MYFRPPDIDVAALRKRMRMTQKQFCRRFGFSLGTLRHWERGDRRPRGTALMLLTIVRHNPRAVVAALGLELRRKRLDRYRLTAEGDAEDGGVSSKPRQMRRLP